MLRGTIINVVQRVWRSRQETYFKAVNVTAFLNMHSTIQYNEAVEEEFNEFGATELDNSS